MTIKPLKLFYTWLLTLVWAVVCFASFFHPGDEYGLWAVGSMPGLWGVLLHGNQGDIHGLLLPMVGAGAVTVLPFALLMDLLRISRKWFFASWALVAVTLFVGVMVFADRPLQRSHTVADGLISYSLAAINVALWFTIVIGLLGALLGRAMAKAAGFLIDRREDRPSPQPAKS